MFKSLEKLKLFLNNLRESQNKVQEYLPKYNHTQHPNSDYVCKRIGTLDQEKKNITYQKMIYVIELVNNNTIIAIILCSLCSESTERRMNRQRYERY